MLRNELNPQVATALPSDISDPSTQRRQRRFIRDRRQRGDQAESEGIKKISVGIETKDVVKAGTALEEGPIDGGRSQPKALAATVTSVAPNNGTVPLASTQMTLRTVTRPSSTAASRLPEFVPITREAVATPAAAQSPSTFLTLARPSTSQPAPASKPTAIPVPAIPASVPQPAVNQPAASIPAPAIVQPAAQLTTIIQMSTVVQPTTVLQMSTIVQPTTIVQMSTVVQPTTISQAGANIQPTPAVAGVPTVPISQTTAFQFQTGAVTLATPSASGQSSSGPKSGFKFEFKPTNVEAALLSGQSPSAAANAITSVGETGTVSGGIAALIVFGILGLLGFFFLIIWACKNRHHAKKTEISASRAGTRANTPDMQQVKH